MPIQYKSKLSSAVANQTFLDKTIDDIKKGKLGLYKVTVGESGAISDVQQFINEIADASGQTEGDVSAKVYSSNNYIANGDSRKVAIGKIDTQLKQTQDDLDAAEVVLADHEARITQNETDISDLQVIATDHENRITDLESNDMTIGGNKTFSGNVTIAGDLEVQGTVTRINTTDTEVKDKNILVNKGGTDGSSEGAGIDIERPSGNAAFRFDSALSSKFKIGLVSAMYEIIVSGIAQTISGIKDFVSGIKVDIINESTLNAGVTIDGVLIKDNLVDGRDVSADYTSLDGRITALETAPSGGGGGGTLLWEKTGDISPQAEIVDGLKLETFSNGYDQELYALITVPSSYQAGQPIKLLSGAFFIAVTTGKILFRTETALIRDGATVLGTYPNVHTSVNLEVDAPAVANTLKQIGDIDLTNGSGQINAVAVAAGDKLRVRLLRKNSSESSPANADAKLLINNFETRFTV